jgi:hypothetical protein
MVGFFENVGTGEGTGYGFNAVPKDPPGAKERFRKARLTRSKVDVPTAEV